MLHKPSRNFLIAPAMARAHVGFNEVQLLNNLFRKYIQKPDACPKNAQLLHAD